MTETLYDVKCFYIHIQQKLKRDLLLPSVHVTLVQKKTHSNINKKGTIETREGLLGPMTVWRNSKYVFV